MGKLVWAAVTALILAGCRLPEGSESILSGDGPIPPGKGQLALCWTGEPGGRTLLGSAWDSSFADYYELLLLGPGGVRTAVLSNGSGQIVAVDPGTYRVVVLAGIKRSSGSQTIHLVGSAVGEAVTVTEGNRTVTDLVLRSISLGWETPEVGYWKGSLTLTATGQTRNPRVGMSLAGPSTLARPRLKSLELWNGYKEFATVTGTPDHWSAEVSGTVPDGVPMLDIGLVGAGLCVQGLDDQWVPTAGLTKGTWTWPNRADLAEAHPLAPFLEVLIPCAPPPTGLEVGLGWE